MSRVHLTFALLILALALPACSSESGAPAQESKPTPASVAPPTTQINPAELRSDARCTIVPQEVLTALLGNSINDMYVLPTDGAEIGCNYEFAGGKSLELRVELARSGQQAFSGIMQYQEVSQGSEDVSLGDVARIQETQQDITLCSTAGMSPSRPTAASRASRCWRWGSGYPPASFPIRRRPVRPLRPQPAP